MSAFKTVCAAIVLSAGLAGAAYARDVFTARLDAPAQQSRVIVDQVIWNCDGDACTARPNRSASVRACRQFARATGARVTAYGSESAQLSADELARCNGESGVQQVQNTPATAE